MTRHAPLQHSILGTMVVPVAMALRRQGIEAAEVFDSVGIDIDLAFKPEARLPAEQFFALMGRCVEVTDEAFGIYAGEEIRPQMLHGLGLGWLASDTVYAGLTRLVRFLKLVSTIDELRLEEQKDFVKLHSRGMAEADNYVPAALDWGTATILRMCELNLGDFLAPVMIEMDRPLPENPAIWESRFASRVKFSSERTCITWSRSDISQHIVTGDPTLARVNDEHATAYIESFINDTITRKVIQSIINRLPDGPPSRDQVAADICVSSRTLQRRLRDEGRSFNQLVQETREQLAKKYLRQPNRSVVQTAYLLGFSEASAFSRAFKRWTGTYPAEYQKQWRTSA